jgi:hypothetical protein
MADECCQRGLGTMKLTNACITAEIREFARRELKQTLYAFWGFLLFVV